VPSDELEALETLRGVLDHVTYQNEESGFVIARLLREGDALPVTIVGTVSALNLGETVEVRGTWTTHPQYGRQFKVTEYRPVLPSSLEGIKRYLGSGLIKGLGPVYAERIVEAFGEKTFEIIERYPGRLREVPGLGPKRIKQIREAWREQWSLRDVMIFLQEHGISPTYAHRIYKHYGPDAVAIVKRDPYRLAREIWGIGFRTADQIARRTGIEPENPQRLAAGLAYVVSLATEQGHIYLPEESLLEQAVEQLGVPVPSLQTALASAVESGLLVREDGRVALPEYATVEREIAERLYHHVQNRKAGSLAESDEAIIARVEARTGLSYAPQQRRAILAALSEGVLVMTGGPGTGKTTTTQGIIGELRAQRTHLALCAPTGRAAKRLAEVTRVEARTIHRMLGFMPDKRAFQYDEEHPLPADLVLVDEASMIDAALFVHLLRALRPDARLVLVGDADQLPSVGPGQVLRDIIASGVVSVIRLETVFRQAERSLIITNAHKINQGEMPSLSNKKDGDFFFLAEEDPEAVAAMVSDLVVRRLPKSYGVDKFSDVQVLAPMYRGETGAHALNKRLQQELNPEGEALARGHHEFRVGDKVIITRNNYTKMVFNGDIGRIVGVDPEQGTVSLELNIAAEGPTQVTYDFEELDELTLAYAISVHRSQGSEFPIVVMPITTQHYMMLQRNVLYTAVTRAKRLMILVGSARALALAVKNAAVSSRFTWLSQRLCDAAGIRPHTLSS